MTRARARELEARWRRDYFAALAEADHGRAEARARAEQLFATADDLRVVHADVFAAAIAAALVVYT